MLLQSVGDVKRLAQRLSRADRFSFDTETFGSPGAPVSSPALVLDRARLKMLSFAFDTETERIGVSIACGPWGLPTSKVMKALKPVMEDPKVLKVMHNANYDTNVVANYDVTVTNYDCTLIAGWGVNENAGNGLDDRAALCGRYLRKVGVGAADLDELAPYAEEDAVATLDIHDMYTTGKVKFPTIEGLDVRDWRLKGFHEKWHKHVEMPLQKVLFAIERKGIKLDGAFLKRYYKKLAKKRDKHIADMYRFAGRTFNTDSPIQIQEIMFTEMGIEPIKRTKTGFSTDHETLLALRRREAAPFLDSLLGYREVNTLIKTYLNPESGLIGYVGEDGRAHPTLKAGVTKTGRLASSNFNEQNIPYRTAMGGPIRKAFVAEKGNVILCCDYDQFELKLIAMFSQDPTMVAVFNDPKGDIHETTRIALKIVQRVIAKNTNFLAFYWGGAYRLCQTLAKGGVFISETRAKKFLSRMKRTYQPVWQFCYGLEDQAEKYGYIETICGRRRSTKDIDHAGWMLNNLIQGSSLDWIKIAMIRLHKNKKLRKMGAHMIAQIHDEILFEVPERHVMDAYRLAKRIMERDPPAMRVDKIVPITVSGGYGYNWLEAKKNEIAHAA